MATMTALAGVEVTAPPVAPYEHGLFSVAPAVPAADPHEGIGAWWQSRACGTVGVTGDACVQDNPAALVIDADACLVSVLEPFWLYAYNTPSAMAMSTAEATTQARENLVNGEQFGVEQALWSVLAAAVTEVAVTALPTGLAFVEQALAEAYKGRGVIHMSRFAATLAADLLEVQGGQLVTKAGRTPVVAGGGYGVIGGAVPANVAVYGTGPVVVRSGALEAVPATIDTAVNRVHALAFRPYVVGYDCAAVGVTVTLS